MVAVQIGFAQSGEVLSAAEHFGRFQSAQKFPGIQNCGFRIGGCRPACQHRTRSFKAKIEDRGKIRIKTQRASFQPQDVAMHAEQLAIAGGKYIFDRRAPAQSLFSGGRRCHLPDRHKETSGCVWWLANRGASATSGMVLQCCGQINHAAGLKRAQRGAQLTVNGKAVVPENEQLPNLLAKAVCGFCHAHSIIRTSALTHPIQLLTVKLRLAGAGGKVISFALG